MRSHLLHQLHDTEIWSSYLPRTPFGFDLLALAGILLGFESYFQLQMGSGRLYWLGVALGFLLLLPALAAWVFVIWKWRQRTTVRREMLDSISWRGDERVLDVGCGSGLMLNGAAAKLKSGKAIGIDVWSPSSGGGNLELLWKNALAEGVADRIDFRRADARAMPFENGLFDVVFSSGALHHISSRNVDHDQAVGEMVRVLKPGGHILIWDVSHMIEATAEKMKRLGIVSQIEGKGRMMGFEMSVMRGEKKV